MTEKRKAYFDYAATTPIDKSIQDRMSFFFDDFFGNPSSIHEYGQIAAGAVDQSRKKVAKTLHCKPEEVIFTSGGTESSNLAIRGTVFRTLMDDTSRAHILTTPVEHHAVSHTVLQMSEYFGCDVEFLPVDQFGRVDPDDVCKSIKPNTVLVSVIYANNEIGTINPVGEIGRICRERDIVFHTDAVQAATWLKFDPDLLMVDLISIGAHKFYGPKGIGALYKRNSTVLIPAQTGGGQEMGYRAGTENVPYIVGLSEALEQIERERDELTRRLLPLRDYIVESVLENIPDVRLTGHRIERLPNHVSLIIKNVDGNLLLTMLDAAGFACSSGSACKVGNPKPSEVLLAIGVDPLWALGSLRITMGKFTTEDEVNSLLHILPDLIKKARRLR